MHFLVRCLFLLCVVLIEHTQKAQLDQDLIVLSQSIASSLSSELIGRGKVGQHLEYSILMPLGFQSYLVNSSDPGITIGDSGLIEIFSDNPGTHTLSVSIEDKRDTVGLNLTRHCPSFHADLHVMLMKNETTESCGKVPTLRQPLDFISLSVGQIFQKQLGPDYFYDTEDGNTRQLSVTLTTGHGNPLPSNHWIQFDSLNQVIYGLVMNETALEEEVLLIMAKDSCGQSAYDAIEVDISGQNYNQDGNLVTSCMIEFSSDPVCPIENLKNVHMFVQELKIWMKNSSKIFINEKKNCTLQFLIMADISEDFAGEGDSNEITNILHQKGEIKSEFLCSFLPGFKITKVEFTKQNFSFIEKDYDAPVAQYSSDINHWLEIVLPVIIVLFLLVILVIILYTYYARKKKLFILQSEKPTFLEERSPVIFQTEVPVEDPILGPRDPIILSHCDDLPSSEVELLDHRSLPSTPDYTPPSSNPPPSYRLPPPYTTSHQYW